jgi:hypothetical protein
MGTKAHDVDPSHSGRENSEKTRAEQEGGGVLGDANFRKSPMKMIYRKFPKTASLPVTCHLFLLTGFLCLNRL